MRRAAVVVLHGLWMGPWQMATLARRLQHAGFAVHRYGYPSIRGDWDTHVHALRAWVHTLQAPVLHWVGHSLGGMLIADLLHRHGAELPPGRVVCLGSPLAGSTVAQRLGRSRWSRWLLGRARSVLVQPAARFPADRAVASIAGTRRVGVAFLTGGLAPPHDGTVQVDETRVPGLTAHACVPTSHTLLVWNRQAADLTIDFLQDRPWPGLATGP